jgi:hypothetical protein
MDSPTTKLNFGGTDYDVLRVPYYTQSDSDSKCYPYSVKMCLEYFHNVYPHAINIPVFNIDEIADILNTRDTGTPIENLTIRLNEKINNIEFKFLEYSNFEIIETQLKKYLPIIVLYDYSYYQTYQRGNGHAGVVVGVTPDSLILNNPWLGPFKDMDKLRFERAWECEHKALIKMTPIRTLVDV